MKMKLIHGDCLDEMKRLPDRSIDLFLCDLPYGCLTNKPHADGTEGKSKGGLRARYIDGKDTGTTLNLKTVDVCAWDVKIDLTAFWEQVERLMKDDHTPIIHFCNTKFGNELINSKPSWFRYDLVWNKMRGVGFLNANKMPMRSHENIYVFAKKGARYNRVDIDDETKKARQGKNRDLIGSVYNPQTDRKNGIVENSNMPEGKRCVLSVVEVSGVPSKGNHPTQKPADLYKWLIERYSNPGDTILDPTAGSFSSCFTAHELGRQAIGIEKDDKFYNKALSLVKE